MRQVASLLSALVWRAGILVEILLTQFCAAPQPIRPAGRDLPDVIGQNPTKHCAAAPLPASLQDVSPHPTSATGRPSRNLFRTGAILA